MERSGRFKTYLGAEQMESGHVEESGMRPLWVPGRWCHLSRQGTQRGRGFGEKAKERAVSGADVLV